MSMKSQEINTSYEKYDQFRKKCVRKFHAGTFLLHPPSWLVSPFFGQAFSWFARFRQIWFFHGGWSSKNEYEKPGDQYFTWKMLSILKNVSRNSMLAHVFCHPLFVFSNFFGEVFLNLLGFVKFGFSWRLGLEKWVWKARRSIFHIKNVTAFEKSVSRNSMRAHLFCTPPSNVH